MPLRSSIRGACVAQVADNEDVIAYRKTRQQLEMLPPHLQERYKQEAAARILNFSTGKKYEDEKKSMRTWLNAPSPKKKALPAPTPGAGPSRASEDSPVTQVETSPKKKKMKMEEPKTPEQQGSGVRFESPIIAYPWIWTDTP